MAASPLIAARNQIATDIAALTPPDDTGIGYHHYAETDGRWFGDGTSLDRCFFFRLLESGYQHDFGSTLAIQGAKLELRVRYNFNEISVTTQFESIQNEGVLIQRAINERGGWPTGVDEVRCDGFHVEYRDPAPGRSDLDVVFAVYIRTQET